MRENRKTIVAILGACIVLIVIAICGKVLTTFKYKDHLDEPVVTVDENSITLRELGYYIFQVEAFVQDQALIYDSENPKHWWNTHFSSGLDSQFVCDYAKKVTINMCVCDELYYQEAMKSGLSLSEAEEVKALEEAKKLLGSMNSQQLEATGLDEGIVIRMQKKHELASKYAKFLVVSLNFTGYNEKPEALVNWDGAYYEEKILPEHVINLNDKVLDKITLGKITVNNEG